MKDIRDDLLNYEEFERKRDGSFYLKAAALIMLVVMLGVYIGNLLFGENSLETLLNLQNQREVLQKKTDELKDENARLQRKYFELKQIALPDTKR